MLSLYFAISVQFQWYIWVLKYEADVEYAVFLYFHFIEIYQIDILMEVVVVDK
jgi:hypothetical protein